MPAASDAEPPRLRVSADDRERPRDDLNPYRRLGRAGGWACRRMLACSCGVWEYEVAGDRAAAFTTAYAAGGAWGELFGRAAGFLGTELYRDTARADRCLTIDRWPNEEDWRSFLDAFDPAYESLDVQLEGLAVAERSLFEGSF